MAEFKVLEIVGGDKIKTSGWRLNDVSGNIVQIRGLAVQSDDFMTEMAKNRLKILLQDKMVALKAAQVVGAGEILCDVFINGINVNSYFTDFKKQ